MKGRRRHSLGCTPQGRATGVHVVGVAGIAPGHNGKRAVDWSRGGRVPGELDPVVQRPLEEAQLVLLGSVVHRTPPGSEQYLAFLPLMKRMSSRVMLTKKLIEACTEWYISLLRPRARRSAFCSLLAGQSALV